METATAHTTHENGSKQPTGKSQKDEILQPAAYHVFADDGIAGAPYQHTTTKPAGPVKQLRTIQRRIDLPPGVTSVKPLYPLVMQRVIDATPGGMALAPGGPPANVFAGLPPAANKTVTRVQATTAPANPPGMGFWKDRGYLADPSKGGRQALTRMHAIRGKFGGPSAANNMFLGTALSNNFHGQSHFRQVEQPLETYIKGAPRGDRVFDYTVTPNFGVVPPYMAARIAVNVPLADRGPFQAFANAHIPDGFNCTADLYNRVGGAWHHKVVHQHVATDVGAPAGAAPGPVAPAHAVAHDSGLLPGLGWGVAGAAVGAIGAGLLSGPVGWSALALGAAGAIYGYATAEHD